MHCRAYVCVFIINLISWSLNNHCPYPSFVRLSPSHSYDNVRFHQSLDRKWIHSTWPDDDWQARAMLCPAGWLPTCFCLILGEESESRGTWKHYLCWLMLEIRSKTHSREFAFYQVKSRYIGEILRYRISWRNVCLSWYSARYQRPFNSDGWLWYNSATIHREQISTVWNPVAPIDARYGRPSCVTP